MYQCTIMQNSMLNFQYKLHTYSCLDTNKQLVRNCFLRFTLYLPYTHSIEFTIRPPVGPGMPLVIPEGGDVTLICRHISRPPFTVNWYRNNTVIRPDSSETINECSCLVPGVDPTDLTVTERELIFKNFAPMSAGEYSCRAPDNFTAGTFNICQFNILVPGEQLVIYMTLCTLSICVPI